MSSLLPDPVELAALADRIAAHADATRARAERLRAALGDAQWQGLAAESFHLAAGAVLAGLHTSAGRLDDTADTVRRHAATVRLRLAELDAMLGAPASAVHGIEAGIEAGLHRLGDAARTVLGL